MAYKEHEKIAAFDTLFSNNHIQMLKIMLPYLDQQIGKHMTIYIKFLELQYTINLFNSHSYFPNGYESRDTSYNFSGLCSQLLPFCDEQEKTRIKQLQSLFQSLEMYKEMSKTMEVMKEFMPDAEDMLRQKQSDGSPFGSQMMDMLMNMLTPEQKEMYEMFKGEMPHAE